MQMNLSQKNIGRGKRKNGFTILFAVLVSILILAVGSAIVTLALKQIILSGSSRDSQFAFYAANTGIECALFWNTNQGFLYPPSEVPGLIFASSSASQQINSATRPEIRCAGRSIYDGGDGGGLIEGLQLISASENSAQTSFWIDFSAETNLPYCAYVIVTKTGGRTQIDSYGYNTCDPDNPRRTERGLRINL